MKYYTEALMNEVKQKKRFSSFFFGDSRRTCYYQATHRENGTYLLWIDLRPCLNPEQTKFIVQEVCGLAVDYGEWFGGDAYKGFIRLNLATSQDNITLAVSRLLAALTE